MAEEFGYYDPMLLPDGTYDREYNAKGFTVPIKALINTGVMKGEMNELAVTSNGQDMITKIDTGIAFINGRYYMNTRFKTHQHDTESLGVSRIDRIVIRMNDETDYRSTLSYVKKGAPSANPMPPALVQTEFVYEISLAQVKIVGGQTFIATNSVTDERGRDVICPWAASNILPSFDDNALGDHIKNDIMHVKYGVDTTTNGNVWAVNIPGITELVDGMAISFKSTHEYATGSAILKVNNLSNISIRRSNGSLFPSNQIKKNGIYTVRYNAGNSSFILQGEGGEIGTAGAPQVLSGYTVGTENGLDNGIMNDWSSSITSGTQISSTTGSIDIVPVVGYYSGNNNSRTRISNSNFSPINIKKGVNIFGIIGALGEKYASGQAYSTTGGQEFIYINNLGFRPRAVIAKLANQSAKNAYAAVYLWSPQLSGDLDFRMADNGTVYANSGTQYNGPTSFRMQVDSINSRLYNWVAFGSEDFN